MATPTRATISCTLWISHPLQVQQPQTIHTLDGAPRISSVPYSTLAQGGRIKSAITQVIMLYIRNFLIRHLWSYLHACINSIIAALVQSTEPSANIQANKGVLIV